MRKKLKLLVDIDGTLTEPGSYLDFGEVRVGVVEALRQLHKNGYKIVIYTCRGWWQEEKIRRWCDAWKIPYDEIICGKPLGIIIDDLAVNPALENAIVWAVEDKMREFERLFYGKGK